MSNTQAPASSSPEDRPTPSVRVPESPREFLKRIGVAYGHQRIAAALASQGYDVASVLRTEAHPAWKVSIKLPQRLSRATPRALRMIFKKALASLHQKWPVQEIDVLTKGSRATLTFLWDVPTLRGLLTMNSRWKVFLRLSEAGVWESRRL